MKTHLLKTLFIAFLLACNASINAQTFQGPNNPYFVTEHTGGCLACPGASWNNPFNASTPDNQHATATLNPQLQCAFGLCYARGLIATGYNFTIPGNAIVKGIKAEVLCKAFFSNSIVDSSVQLWLNGPMPVGINHALSTFWQNVPMYQSYGDSADTWGLTLTPIDINSSDFGLFFQPINRNSLSLSDVYVDHVRLTVYYETTSGIGEQILENSMLAYFNTFNNSIQLQTDNVLSNNNSVSLYNSIGQLIYSKYFSNELLHYIPAAGNGIYTLQLQLGEKIYVQKIPVTF